MMPQEAIDILMSNIDSLWVINCAILVKISSTISIVWMVFIGYLIWWNGIQSPGFNKSFKWDEWIWFGLVPAIVPFIFYLIWKKKD